MLFLARRDFVGSGEIDFCFFGYILAEDFGQVKLLDSHYESSLKF